MWHQALKLTRLKDELRLQSVEDNRMQVVAKICLYRWVDDVMMKDREARRGGKFVF